MIYLDKINSGSEIFSSKFLNDFDSILKKVSFLICSFFEIKGLKFEFISIIGGFMLFSGFILLESNSEL